jgi:peptidoglycan/LPS O-acetylase OafA/YrhL
MSFSPKHYRWDIQGLRAIAVLAVVLFHINPTLLPGGYIGVDIFFVISGYLIMGFIWRDLKNENFSLLNFYTKRVYRLFPALFVTIIFSSIAAYLILLPSESEIYLKSMVSTLFYFSNFYFYSQANYFNDAMEFYPLLHTWSLSVEEQFYMVFPLILMFIYRKKMKYVFTVLLLLGLLSLILSQWYVNEDASFAFFSSPTRFFQFIIGGLIAIFLQGHKVTKKGSDIAIIVGLGIILYTLYSYSEKTLFPGVNALLPTFGAGLVMYFGSNAGYMKLFLENRVISLIGNASYSIYLWHWPLLVFYKLKYSPNLSSKEQSVLLLVSIFLGIFSWYFVENRFRKSKLSSPTVKPIITILGVSFLFVIANIIVFKYFPSKTLRYQQKAAQYLKFNTEEFRAGTCFLTSKYNDVKFYDKDLCVTYKEGKKNYLLFGDSHAAHFYSALVTLLQKDETLTQVTTSGCNPLLPYRGAKRCVGLNKWAYEELIPTKHFDVIILSALWFNIHKKDFQYSLNQLAKYTDKLIVFGPSLSYMQPLPRLLLNLKENTDNKQIYKTASYYNKLSSMDKTLKSYVPLDKVKYVSLLNTICDTKGCMTVTPDGTPINFDDSHLTHEGALYILKQIEDEILDR